MKRPPEVQQRGAYGLALPDLALSPALLVPAAGWPGISVTRTVGTVDVAENRLDAERATITLGEGGGLVVDRVGRAASFTTPFALSDDELLHPYLAPVGGVFAWWAGRQALHAGGFVAGGRVWALLGGKEAGKSSALAWLALAGVPVVCDDMLVLDGDAAFAGPRCLDLRPGTAAHLEVGESIPVQGPRERWRLELGPVAPTLPFGGWIELAWGDAVEVDALRPAERLPVLARHRSLLVESPNPAGLLDLVGFPGWRIRRPRSWDALDDAMGAVLDTVS